MNWFPCRRAWIAAVCVAPLAASAATRTELAGNPLTQFPFFEYVRAFNVNAPVSVAIDPSRFPSIARDTCDVYVVAHKDPAEWAASPGLTDVTPDGALTRTFSATNIQANTFVVADASTLDANAGHGLGVGYDVVLDCDQDGSLSAPDFIDGLGDEAGLYMVHDTTTDGPEPVTTLSYNIDPDVGAAFGIPAWRLGQHLFFPSNIATLGRRPIVMISHGNGYMFNWYSNIGNHLASYGYIVVSHGNDTGPGSVAASLTTLGHTQAFIDLAEAGAIADGQLVGHLDTHRIVWIGHSRGGEGVVIAYDSLFDGTVVPSNFSRDDVRFVSSMAPTDFTGTETANPHDANFHLWTASGDSDVNGAAGFMTEDGVMIEAGQTFHLADRATGYHSSTVIQGTGHGWFSDGEWHGGDIALDVMSPCNIGQTNTHLVLNGMLLPLVLHYVEGNVPALDFFTRQYETFRPIGVPSEVDLACLQVTTEYHGGADVGDYVIDDYQSGPGTARSSSGGAVTFDVENVVEGRLDDNNDDFTWDETDPFNGATSAADSDPGTEFFPPVTRDDDSSGVVFDWTGEDRFYEWSVPSGANDFRRFLYLTLRGAQGTQHPNTVANTGDATFSLTLRDGAGTTSTINIGAYGGGLEKPFDRRGGWHNEMETVRVRLTDFLNNGSTLDLSNITAVRLNAGPSFGSSQGRIVVDDVVLTNYLTPGTLSIIEPARQRPSFGGTSVAGNRVLVRLFVGGGLDPSTGFTFAVDGVALSGAQIPTPPSPVGGEIWAVIAPGPKPDGCYELRVTLDTPTAVTDIEPAALCYEDDEVRAFDRVLAIDKTTSMIYDSITLLPSDEKMRAARAAAKFFVDLSNPIDRIGVISFQRRDQDDDGSIVEPDELAEPEFEMVPAGEGASDERPRARSSIDLIGPDSSPGFHGLQTSPGAGLEEARAMIDARGIAEAEDNIVLITDGLENHAPFWSRSGGSGPLRAMYEAGSVRVDTVGVGTGADDVLLQDIAAVTGGEFRNLNEGRGSYFLLSRLADFYKSVDEEVRGEQRFYYQEGIPPLSVGSGTSGAATHYRQRIAFFEVEPALDWMTVAFHWNEDGAAIVQLFPPGATTPITISPPVVTLRSDSMHSVYRIRTPAAGRWSYLVSPRREEFEFFAVASGPTALTAKKGPNQLQRRMTDFLMPIRLWIAERQSVTGASVTGYVRRPDGVKTPVTLLDDGASMDGFAGDGIYGHGYVATLPGAYYVHLEATGVSPLTGQPFTRYQSTSFVLPSPKNQNPPGEGGPISLPGARCNCEAEARGSLATYVGRTFPQGSFNSIADPDTSVGVKVARRLPAFGGRVSAGLFLGRDNSANTAGGPGFHVTHLSPEVELWPWQRLCPKPSLQVGVGGYRDETGSTHLGFNAGFGITFCLRDRLSLLGRYDFRRVDALERQWSTVQLGLRWSF